MTGNYLVKLTVTNAATGCSFTKAEMISLMNEKANFTVSDSVICKGIPINFSTININGGNIAFYFWDFGDGSSATAPGSARHIYTLAGTYSVTLIITDYLGCSDT